MVAKNQNDKNIFKFVLGILAIIIYAIVLVRFRAHFIDILFDLAGGPGGLPLLTKISVASPIWLYLIINCISPFLLVLTWAFWNRRYRRLLLFLFSVLIVLYLLLYGIALYLPLMLIACSL